MNTPNRRLRIPFTAYCLLLGPLLASAAGENLLDDPGFEAAAASGGSGWKLFDESRVSTGISRSGSQSMFNWGFSRTVAYPPYFIGSVSGAYQELPATAGSQWQLTGYGSAPAGLKGTPAFGIIQISFFDAEGNDLGTVETAGGSGPVAKISNEINSTTTAKDWVYLDTGVATAPEGTTSVQAFTLYVDYSGSNVSQGVHFDDLSLTRLD